MSQKIVYSLVIRDIAVTTDEVGLQRDLASRYAGVANVTRLYFEGEDDIPKSAVQVDFTSAADARKILQERSILINGAYRGVHAIRKPTYQPRTPQQDNQVATGSVCEQDIVNLFAEQRRRLAEMLNSFEVKLNQAIAAQ